MQIGNQKYPDYPIHSCSEAFYHLKKTVGDHIKTPGAGFTGLNTKAGDVLTVNFRDCNYNNDAATSPTNIVVASHYDAMLNIKYSGVEVLELMMR
eukprot:16433436-Heterocapsa_arctica.AAC.1